MHLVLDIFQGLGVATAVGIRPFLPGVAAAALAAGDVNIHFTGGAGYGFLQSAPLIFVLVVGAVVLLSVERGLSDAFLRRRPVLLAVGLLSLALGALFFAGALARDHHTAWPGLIAGALCAAAGLAATRPLLLRVRARLGAGGAGTVPLYAEAFAVLLAALSIVAPPLGPIALASLLWLLAASRRRGEQKYAGLRILR